jgi:hypothetical protein
VHPLSAFFIGLAFAAITIAASIVPQATGVDSGELLMLLGFALFGYGIFTAVRRGGELLDFLRVNLCVAANEVVEYDECKATTPASASAAGPLADAASVAVFDTMVCPSASEIIIIIQSRRVS